MKPRKGLGSYRDAAGRLWKFWRGRWRPVKEAPPVTVMRKGRARQAGG